jgi:dinuclear metal center YbgI/SA1388 family protein
MIPTLKDFILLLEDLASQKYAEDWDNSGFQLGRQSRKIKKVLMSLDPTVSSVKSAASKSVDLLLTHHPLIFRPISKIDYEQYPGSVIYQAIKEDVCIVAAHTNLDVVKGGINDILAELLDLRDTKFLSELEGVEPIGPGRIGNLPEAVDLAHALDKIKEAIGVEALGISGKGRDSIKRVAVVGGSGGSFVQAAFKSGADLLITGDVGHHHSLEAIGLGLVVVDAGHYNMEKKAFSIFSERLKREIKNRDWGVVIEVDNDERAPSRWSQ